MELAPGQVALFSAEALHEDGSFSAPQVMWAATGGTIDQGGSFTAGSTSGVFAVTATSEGSNVTGAAVVTVTITSSPTVSIALSPGSASLNAGATQAFTVVATRQDGSTYVPPVTWSSTGGTVTSGGLYTAGSSAGVFRVVATQQGGSLADTAAITITTVTLQALTLTPASASLSTGGTQQFGVSGQWSNGSTSAPLVSYTATGGTISPGGLYTAGSTAGSFRVIALHSASGLADTSSVTLTAPVLEAVVLTPSSVAMATGSSRLFTVSGQWSNGATTAPAVTFSATGGTITAGGLYTAGAATGSFRVIAVQQGGTLADTSTVTLSLAPPNDMYFNSSESGCGTDPSLLLCDDFEDGDWYSKNCDQANASGGLLQTDGWCGTIYANPITPAGAAVCGGAGFGGSNCAATGGYHTGSADGGNMAEHRFAGGVAGLDEAYFRLYFQPQADYVGGHEKMFDFTRGSNSGQMVALCYNYFGSQTIRCIPYLHQDDGLQGQVNAWMGSNMASTVTLVPGRWYYFEMRVKMNTPGSYNGVFEWWMNDCGTTGAGCTGSPTLRGRYTNVKYRNAGSESSVALGGVWIENWANPGTRGTMYYDNVIAASSGPIGFLR